MVANGSLLMSTMLIMGDGGTDLGMLGGKQQYQSTDTLMALRRRERYLQRDLQNLLDAQSDGLMSGLQGRDDDDDDGDDSDDGNDHDHDDTSYGGNDRVRRAGDVASSGSTLRPSVADDMHRSKGPATLTRQSKKRYIPLRQARQAICHVMRDLAAIKAVEVDALTADEEANAAVLARMERWDEKRVGLEAEMDRIEHRSAEASRAAEARAETEALGSEIRGLEERLAELRLRHRRAREEAETLENRVQAQLSSYREARALLDKEVRAFIRDPPAQGNGLGVLAGGVTGNGKGKGYKSDLLRMSEALSFASMPPKRRTYELARETWMAEQKELARVLKRVTLEQEALEEGSRLWGSVSDLVTTFEGDLRAGLEKVAQHHPSINLPSQSTAGISDDANDSVESIDKLAARMDKVTAEIERSYRTAEERGWKLLLCCIGAELEAFRQGRHVLKDSLGLMGDGMGIGREKGRGDADEVRESKKGSIFQQNNADIANGTRLVNGHGAQGAEKLITDTDDVDEEPDPELLIARRESYID